MSLLKLAVISDIHGNRWALEAVLRDIQQREVTQIVNLGDSVLGPLDPENTAQLLIQHNIPSICGNDDRVLISPPENPSILQVHVRKMLTETSLNWLQTLPPTHIIDDVLLCHGTPASDQTYLLEEVSEHGVSLRNADTITAYLKNVSQQVILCGHSHIQRFVTLAQGNLIANPGSVGLPAYTSDEPFPHAMEAGNPYAKYMLLQRGEDMRWQIEHISILYAWETAAEYAQNQHFTNWVTWLTTGRAS
jgi:putative phosphoesterase